MFEILTQYNGLLLKGFFTTLKLLGLIILIGVPLGVWVGAYGARHSKRVNALIKGLKFVTKVVPVLVLLFWLHFPLQAILGIVVDPFWTTVIALGFVNFVAVAYIVQTDLELLPASYREAGLGLGLSKAQIVRYIELPIMFRRTFAAILLNQAVMLEYTLFASLIAVPELFRVAQTINSITYDPVSVYSLIVVFFLIILVPMHVLVSYFKRKYKVIYV
jgi:His/Glu/Gln/Arg/opine family amino acid ABC transporter permease subunit